MKMKVIAGFGFFLNTLLFATYYAVAKEALGRIDPIVFTFFEMVTLAPVGLVILAFTYQHMTWPVVKRGALLGSCLCLAFFTIAIALKYSTATGTAFFPALNGFLAALIAWLVLRQPMRKATWVAGLFSIAGTTLLIANSDMGGTRGAVIAFLGGLFFTLYVFFSDYGLKELEAQNTLVHWPLLAIELLASALWASLIVLLFGDWESFHPVFPKDALVILYVAGACTFLPTLIAVLMQKYISVVTISFIYILEPVLGAVIALLYLHEILPLAGYIGGGLVFLGALVHTWGSAGRAEQTESSIVHEQNFQQTTFANIFSFYIAPILYCCSGFLILYGLGGFPPEAWSELAPLAPVLDVFHPERRAMAVAVLNVLLQGPQRQSFLLLVVQAVCWLIGWGVLGIFVCMTVFRIARPADRDTNVLRGRTASYDKIGRNELRFQQGNGTPAHSDGLWTTQESNITPYYRAMEAITEEPALNKAVWSGPVDMAGAGRTWFGTPFEVQEVTTDELAPVLPVLSIPTHGMERAKYSPEKHVGLVEYEEQLRRL